MTDSLQDKIDRIYAALGTSVEKDMTRLPAEVTSTPRFLRIHQDFSGAQSQAELENLAYSLVHNIANLRDHLRKWAKAHGKDPDAVDQAVEECAPLQTICDLSNADKHGGHGRQTWSGRRPSLANVTRVLRLTTKPEKGSRVVARLGRIPRISGDGTAEAILTGEVVDENGQTVGTLHALAAEGVRAWEKLLRDYKIGP